MVVHEHVGATGDRLVAIAGAVDGGLVAAALHHRRFNINIGVTRDAAIVVAAVDGILHDGVGCLVVNAGDVVVAVAGLQLRLRSIECRIIALAATEDGVDLGRGRGGHIHTGVADEAFLVTAAIDVVEAAGVQVDSSAAGTVRRLGAHAGKSTATIDIHIREAVAILGLGVVDEDIGLLLHGVVQVC